MICRYRTGVDIIEKPKGVFKEKYRFSLGGLLIWFLDNFTSYYSNRATSNGER